MKCMFLSFVLLSFALLTKGQVVDWKFEAIKTAPNQYNLLFTAEIASGWHIYAQEQPQNSIAQPTVIQLTPSPLITIKGKPKEIGNKEFRTYRSLGVDAFQYEDKVVFVQAVTTKVKAKIQTTGKLTFQACNESGCLVPETIPFTFKLE